MTRTFTSRWAFLIGVAFMAAAVGDAFVESVSNAGLVGSGYRDDDHQSVIPALVGGCALALELAILRCIAIVRAARSTARGGGLRSAAADISSRGVRNALPYVLAMQFVALFLMESSEQLVQSGHLAGGVAWLGGPFVFSICAHVTIGALCTLLLTRSMAAIVASLTSLVRAVVRLVLATIATDAASSRTFHDKRAVSRTETSHARPFGGRAPPRHLSLAP